jgi:hypothetical protein
MYPKDQKGEDAVVAYIKAQQSAEPTIKVAEIVRRLTKRFPPLGRAKVWHSTTVSKLIKFHELKSTTTHHGVPAPSTVLTKRILRRTPGHERVIQLFSFRDNLFEARTRAQTQSVYKPTYDASTTEVLGAQSYVNHYNKRCNDSKLTNIIGYVRVSLEHQEKEASIKVQIGQIVDACKSKDNYNLLYICVDVDISGLKTREERPGLNYLLYLARSGEKIMFMNINSLCEDHYKSAAMDDQLEGRAIKYHILDPNIDTSNPEDTSVYQMLKIGSQYRRRITKHCDTCPRKEKKRRNSI